MLVAALAVRSVRAATVRRHSLRGVQRLAKIHMEIRKAVEADIPSLLPLMRELAEFEKYAEDFAVTEEVLREQGFRHSPPDFHCLVAEQGGELVGFLVYYFVAFTYRAKPNLIIKELYIAGPHRSRRSRQIFNESCRERSCVGRLRHD